MAKEKRVELLRYTYPSKIIISVDGKRYTYESSEPCCRRFMVGLRFGSGFRALNKFKEVATLVAEEEV